MSDEIKKRAQESADRLGEHARELDKLRKALAALGGDAAWDDRAARRRAVDAMRRALDDEAGLFATLSDAKSQLGDFFGELEPALEAHAQTRRARFLDDFVAAISEAGLQYRELGQQPPVLDVQGVQITIDFDKESASLAYGREPLAKSALDAPELLRVRKEQVRRLKASFPGPQDFFAAIDAAYRARVGREGRTTGDRVDLVDLLPELAVEYELRSWLGQGASIGRAELAFGLDRLAREGVLEQGGRRIELGSATGGTTRDKKRVLFLQAGLGGGQYYLSLRVTEAT